MCSLQSGCILSERVSSVPMKSLALTLIASLMLVCATTAQTPRGQEQKLFVSVMNKAGQYIPNLKAQDFILEENGSRQEIASFKPDSDAPVSLGILIDKSTSMRLPVATQ